MRIATVVKSLIAVTALGLPLVVNAESNVQTGAGPLTATAHVDFQITIPKVLYLRVGTGSNYAGAPPVLTNVGNVDLIQFSPAAGTVGNGTAVAGTGGDLTNGVETAAIVSNSGNVTLTATATGALSDGGAPANTITFTQITTTASTLTSATALPAPTLADTTGSTVTLTAPATKIIVQDAKWTYSYANSVTPPAGTYGGVNVRNSRITYTATMP